jgi:DNA-binding transcriptional MerR regulator
MTIDQLAQRVGMTARNVRAYQSRGLIPPPLVRGRTGYYGEEHVSRLELIRDLQAEGFNLEAIKRILSRAPGASVGEVLDFTRAVAAPFSDERPEVMDTALFAERWGPELTPELVRKVEKLGLVTPLADGLWEVRSPRLMRAATELTEAGVPLKTAVETAATLKRHADAVARAYVDLFLDHVWTPFDEAGEPVEDWPKVREALERLRPLAGESLLATFQIVMTDAVEKALADVVSRLSEPDAARRKGDSRSRARRGRSPRRPARR